MTQKGKLAAFTRATFSRALTEAQFDAMIRIAEGYHLLAKKGYPDAEKTAIEILNLIGQQFPSTGKQREELIDAFFKEVVVPNSPFRQGAYDMFINVALVLDKTALNPTVEGKRLTDFFKKELDYSTNNLKELQDKKPFVEKKIRLLDELGQLSSKNDILNKIDSIRRDAMQRQATIIEQQSQLAKIQLDLISKLAKCDTRDALEKFLNESDTQKNIKILSSEKERLEKLLKSREWDPKDASIRKKIIEIEFLENLSKHDVLKEMNATDIKQYAKDHLDSFKDPEEMKLAQKLEELENKMKLDLDAELKTLTQTIESLKKVKNAETLLQMRNTYDPQERTTLENMEREIYKEKSWLPSWLPLPILRFLSTVDMAKEIKAKVSEKTKAATKSKDYLDIQQGFQKEKEALIIKIKERHRETKTKLRQISEGKAATSENKEILALLSSERERKGMETLKMEAQYEQQKIINSGVTAEQIAKKDSEYRNIQEQTIQVLERVKDTLEEEGLEGLKGSAKSGSQKRGLLEKEKESAVETLELLKETQKENEDLVKQFEVTLKEDVSYNVGKSRFLAVKTLLEKKVNAKSSKERDINTLGFENSIITVVESINSLTYKKAAIDMLPTVIEQEREDLSFKSKIIQSLLSPEIRSYVSDVTKQKLAYLTRTVQGAPKYSKPNEATELATAKTDGINSGLTAAAEQASGPLSGTLNAVSGTLSGLGNRLKNTLNQIREIRDTLYTAKETVGEVKANAEKDLKLTEDYVRNHLRQARDDISNITFNVLKSTADSLSKIIAANPKTFEKTLTKDNAWVTNLKDIDQILGKVKILDNRFEDFISTHKNMENTAEYRLQIAKMHKKRNELYKESRDLLIKLSSTPPVENNFHLASLLSLVHRTMAGVTDLQDGVNAFEGAYRVISNKLTDRHVSSFEALEKAGTVDAPMDDKLKMARGVLNTALEKFDSKNLQEMLLNKALDQQLGFLEQFNNQLETSLMKDRLPKDFVIADEPVDEILKKLAIAVKTESQKSLGQKIQKVVGSVDPKSSSLALITPENKMLQGADAANYLIETLRNKTPKVELPQWVETFRLLKKLGFKGDASKQVLGIMLKVFKDNVVTAKRELFDSFNVANNLVMQNKSAYDAISIAQTKATAFKEFKQQFLMLTQKQQDYLKDNFKNDFNLITESLNMNMERKVILNTSKEMNTNRKGISRVANLETDRKLLETLFLEFGPSADDVNKFKANVHGVETTAKATAKDTAKDTAGMTAEIAVTNKAEGLSALASKFAANSEKMATKMAKKPKVVKQFTQTTSQTQTLDLQSPISASDNIDLILAKLKASTSTHDPALSFADSHGKILHKKDAAKNIILALQQSPEELPLTDLLTAIKCFKTAKIDVSDIGGKKVYADALIQFKEAIDTARREFIDTYTQYIANLRKTDLSGPTLDEREKAIQAIAPKLERYKQLEKDFNEAIIIQHKGKNLLEDKADAKQIKDIKGVLEIGLENQKSIFDHAKTQYEKVRPLGVVGVDRGVGIDKSTDKGLKSTP